MRSSSFLNLLSYKKLSSAAAKSFLPEWMEAPSVKSLKTNGRFKCSQGLAGMLFHTLDLYYNTILQFSMKLINLLLECEFSYGAKYL